MIFAPSSSRQAGAAPPVAAATAVFLLCELPNAALLVVVQKLDAHTRRSARAANRLLREICNIVEDRMHIDVSAQV